MVVTTNLLNRLWILGIKPIRDRLAQLTQLYTVTINTTNWVGTSAPYTQEITINGILETDTPIIDVVLSSMPSTALLQERAWNCVSRIVTSTNKITIYCNKKKPTVAIPIQIKVVR